MEYVDLLKEEYLQRKNRRPAYSERAFARDLHISPGFLSLLFSGKRTLSSGMAFQIGLNLSWDESKVDSFVALVQKTALKKTPVRTKAIGKQSQAKYADISVDEFRLISDLNHVSVIALVQTTNVTSPQDVVAKLEMTEMEADLVLKRLLRLGILTFSEGRYKESAQDYEVGEVPSEAIRGFHKAAINKALASIEEQSPDQRNIESLTLSYNPEQMEDVKKFMNKFLRAFETKFGKIPNGEIYQLNLQFFSLSRRGK